MPSPQQLERRTVRGAVWFGTGALDPPSRPCELKYIVFASEEEVGRAMLAELEASARAKAGDLAIVLLGGRGAQAFHRQLGELARTSRLDPLLARLHVFTQDALAPLRMDNAFSFVRDFERLLGRDFFRKVKSFTPMRTDVEDFEEELKRYVEKIWSVGGIDLFFLGHGPEPGAASHLAYIKPGAGARAGDWAGIIPISQSILEHHIAKFKAGGSPASDEDERECRAVKYILTLGPAAILNARRVVQSIVDASTAPAKRASYRRVLETEIANDPAKRAAQLDENPGLWIRLHPNATSFILPDVL